MSAHESMSMWKSAGSFLGLRCSQRFDAQMQPAFIPGGGVLLNDSGLRGGVNHGEGLWDESAGRGPVLCHNGLSDRPDLMPQARFVLAVYFGASRFLPNPLLC